MLALSALCATATAHGADGDDARAGASALHRLETLSVPAGAKGGGVVRLIVSDPEPL